MNIVLNNVGKKFAREWVFKNVDLDIKSGEQWSIVGNNGSGKSTLLQIISASMSASQGDLQYSLNGKALISGNIYKEITICGPYMSVIEELTLNELIDFHLKFKSLHNDMSKVEFIDLIELSHAKNKLIKYYSSGMKQRVKLGLSMLSKASLILLDEPLSNLDKNGSLWYHKMIQDHSLGKTMIVCSTGHEEEYQHCTNGILMSNYKK